MKIAVTGATGFIGSEVIKVLLKKKKISIIATYNKSKIIKKNKVITYKKLDIYKKNFNFYKHLRCPDIVINLSWSGLPNYQSKHHIKKELKAQKNFIKNLVSNGLKNIFISGTCYEYGKKDGELNEKMRINPMTSYAVAKNYLRKYVLGLRKKYKFNLIWGRIFYVYGKIKSRKTLYSSILDSFNKKKELEVQGELIRDYLSVQELSKYIVELSLKRKNIKTINICSGKGVSLKQIVRKISNIEKINPNIKFIKSFDHPFESEKFWGSNKKIKFYLNI